MNRRFVVEALINGEGFVVVDRTWREPMIGPYARRERAQARADVFEADPSQVPPASHPAWCRVVEAHSREDCK